MPKTKKIKKIDLEKTVMQKVKSNEISMRPHWYFVLGSALSFIGLIGLSVIAVFLVNITLFLSRQHGPMGEAKFQTMINSFPWWIPVVAVVSIISGVFLLKKYDFSYKRNFWLVVLGFVVAIIVAGFVIDYSGLNETWSRQGPMKRFYQQFEDQGPKDQRGRGQVPGRMQGPGYRFR